MSRPCMIALDNLYDFGCAYETGQSVIRNGVILLVTVTLTS